MVPKGWRACDVRGGRGAHGHGALGHGVRGVRGGRGGCGGRGVRGVRGVRGGRALEVPPPETTEGVMCGMVSSIIALHLVEGEG